VSWYDQFDNQNKALLDRIRGLALFLTVMAVFSLLVLAFGILSLLSADTQAGTREMGLRRALGSRRWTAIATVAGETAVFVFIASAVGALISLAFIQPLLAALKPLLAGGGNVAEASFAPGSAAGAILAAAAASLLTAALASLYPTWSASRLPPSDALRET
jgi:ABC-type antimicrobial peptide transport system permease subunit